MFDVGWGGGGDLGGGTFDGCFDCDRDFDFAGDFGNATDAALPDRLAGIGFSDAFEPPADANPAESPINSLLDLPAPDVMPPPEAQTAPAPAAPAAETQSLLSRIEGFAIAYQSDDGAQRAAPPPASPRDVQVGEAVGEAAVAASAGLPEWMFALPPADADAYGSPSDLADRSIAIEGIGDGWLMEPPEPLGNALGSSLTAASTSGREQGGMDFRLAPGQTCTENADGTVTLTNATGYGSASVTGSPGALGLTSDASPAYQRIVNGRNGRFFDSTPFNVFLGQGALGFGDSMASSGGQQAGTPATQGTGPWSDPDYRNGSDIESDNAAAGPVPAPTPAPDAPVTNAAPPPAEPTARAPDDPPLVAAVPPPPTQVTVQPGDSLYRIAARLAGTGASAGEINDIKNRLAAANPQLHDLNRLSPGQVLNLPTAGTAVDAFSLARLAAADAQYQAQRQAQRPVDPQAPVFTDGPLTLDQAGPSFSDLVGPSLPPTLGGAGLAVQGNTAALTAATGATLVLVGEGGGTLGGSGVVSALSALARLAALPLATLTALFTPTNATVQYLDLGEGMRFKTQPGESYGLLQRQQSNGEWVTDAKVIRPEQISGMLTPAERARLLGPLPGQQPAPPAGGPLITPMPAEGEGSPQVPGYEGEAPQGSSTTTTPIHQPTWQDLLIEQGNADKDYTRPTGTLGGRPAGEREAMLPNASAEFKRGIARQNEAGEALANAGYRVIYLETQNASGITNPDLSVEGRIFDVYSPAAETSARNIVTNMAKKVGADQTERVVLNMADSPVSRNELRAAFNAATTGIKEVIVIGPDKIIYRLP